MKNMPNLESLWNKEVQKRFNFFTRSKKTKNFLVEQFDTSHFIKMYNIDRSHVFTIAFFKKKPEYLYISLDYQRVKRGHEFVLEISTIKDNVFLNGVVDFLRSGSTAKIDSLTKKAVYSSETDYSNSRKISKNCTINSDTFDFETEIKNIFQF